MGAAVKITRTEHGPAELHALAGGCRDGVQAKHLLAMALVMEGASQLEAGRQMGMDPRPCAIGCIEYRGRHLANEQADTPPSGGHIVNQSHPGGATKPCHPFSSHEPTAIVVRSPYCGPMIWTPIGNPSAEKPIGATVAGRR